MKLKTLAQHTNRMFHLFFLLFSLFSATAISDSYTLKPISHQFGPFNQSYYNTLSVIKPATISNEALQITPDSAGNFTLTHRSGRVLFNQPFKLYSNNSEPNKSPKIISFNTSFLINVYRINTSVESVPGEGVAFVIASDLELPNNSDGQYLGLTNSSTDGKANNHFIAIELDTFKQDFDPDNNHLGLNINSVKSEKTVSLSDLGIEIAPNVTRFHMVWIQYDGVSKILKVYIAEQEQEANGGFFIKPKPKIPIMTANVDLRKILKQYSYFGFSASTGSSVQLNCVLRWNLTLEVFPKKEDKGRNVIKIGFGVGLVGLVLGLMGLGLLGYYLCKKRKATKDSKILGALKSLPGTPREFSYSELKKATNKFDDKYILGQGGFGVVYRGVLPTEKVEVAVKKFSRENIRGKDDFLAELTIINRLRHKHLVRLQGWCHKNETLLLVYDYMPNGSLDNHLFCGSEKTTLSWNLRYKIITGVASSLHYLHNEYDQKVVHRDLKASNIMLDSNFNPRLGDFGLARALENEKTSYAELEGVQGTMGYIAPECFHTGKATCESDVYGFGAVLLEVVCGKRPWTKIDCFQFLVDWVWCLHREGTILKAVDERLGGDFVEEEAERLLLLGLACSHPIASERPKTQAIVQIICGSVAVPYVPPFRPAFVWPSMPEGVGVSSMSMASTISTGSSWLIGSNSNSEWTPGTPHEGEFGHAQV